LIKMATYSKSRVPDFNEVLRYRRVLRRSDYLRKVLRVKPLIVNVREGLRAALRAGRIRLAEAS
jgi:hypothetical protein